MANRVCGLWRISFSEEGIAVEQPGEMMYFYNWDQVEGHPYTWLLIDMGAPGYDEDGRIRKYSDEVFWFDFEGSDYIDILQGMLALSKGSCLDSVTDIREDTGKVDWARGTGTVTVSLNWNDTQYRWDVEAYYDWIDGDVLGMLNTLLKEADSREFFYATGDDGQGAIDAPKNKVTYLQKNWIYRIENEG